MDSGVAEHTEGNAGEAGRINYEELVKSIYPLAFCKKPVRVANYLELTYVILSRASPEIPEERGFTFYILSPHCDSETRAWERAWTIISAQMMAKLEK